MATGKEYLFVSLYFRQPIFANRDALGFTIIIPDCPEWQRLDFFLQRQARCVVAFVFGSAKFFGWFQQSNQQCTNHVARSNGPCRNSIDTSVKIVEADVNTTEKIISDNFPGCGQQIII